MELQVFGFDKECGQCLSFLTGQAKMQLKSHLPASHRLKVNHTILPSVRNSGKLHGVLYTGRKENHSVTIWQSKCLYKNTSITLNYSVFK